MAGITGSSVRQRFNPDFLTQFEYVNPNSLVNLQSCDDAEEEWANALQRAAILINCLPDPSDDTTDEWDDKFIPEARIEEIIPPKSKCQIDLAQFYNTHFRDEAPNELMMNSSFIRDGRRMVRVAHYLPVAIGEQVFIDYCLAFHQSTVRNIKIIRQRRNSLKRAGHASPISTPSKTAKSKPVLQNRQINTPSIPERRHSIEPSKMSPVKKENVPKGQTTRRQNHNSSPSRLIPSVLPLPQQYHQFVPQDACNTDGIVQVLQEGVGKLGELLDQWRGDQTQLKCCPSQAFANNPVSRGGQNLEAVLGYGKASADYPVSVSERTIQKMLDKQRIEFLAYFEKLQAESNAKVANAQLRYFEQLGKAREEFRFDLARERDETQEAREELERERKFWKQALSNAHTTGDTGDGKRPAPTSPEENKLEMSALASVEGPLEINFTSPATLNFPRPLKQHSPFENEALLVTEMLLSTKPANSSVPVEQEDSLRSSSGMGRATKGVRKIARKSLAKIQKTFGRRGSPR
jgi:hypothetical protein